ncbi:hypothetical protein ABMY26_00800 (plasmid) [Azospirillum sp. HJ39]|uniref:hypothetical protein n=1 Tax=Azospirillum sp. HJ39 TaxID=3159496 RepID=UPI0035573429
MHKRVTQCRQGAQPQRHHATDEWRFFGFSTHVGKLPPTPLIGQFLQRDAIIYWYVLARDAINFVISSASLLPP